MSVRSDSKAILDNETGPVSFRTTRPFAKLSISGSGTLQSWTGKDWDPGLAISESSTLTSPGTYRLTLDLAGSASVNEG